MADLSLQIIAAPARHAGLSVTGNLFDYRKVITPTPAIKRASICDRGYYVAQFATLHANTDIRKRYDMTLNHRALFHRSASRVFAY